MPEIIEVKTYTDFVKKNIINDQLLNIRINQGRYKTHKPFDSYYYILQKIPLRVLNVQSKGKFMYIELENNIFIGSTLGLTGGWFYRSNNSKKIIHGLNNNNQYALYDKEKAKQYITRALNHLNIEFKFTKGILYYYDQLSFGTISIYKNIKEIEKKLSTIGLDIMNIETTFETFKEKITLPKNINKPIGNVLVNQKNIAGIGNYLRADAMWLSKVSPFRLVKQLNNKELYDLYYNLRLLSWGMYNYKQAIKHGIISTKDKLPTHYKRLFFVYAEKHDIYGNEISKEKLYEGNQIRYIHWAKNYQK